MSQFKINNIPFLFCSIYLIYLKRGGIMRKVELRMNELEKYHTIKKLVEKDGNKLRAAAELDLSLRQINRLVAGYTEYGKAFFVHGNRGRAPVNTLSEDFKNSLEDLYVTKYFDCTYTLFSELLAERENIYVSVDEVRCILNDRYILSPKAHKVTKKNMKKRLIQLEKDTKGKKEKLKIQTNIVALEDAHPRQPRSIYFGEEVQMDASKHRWFANIQTYLHAAIDDSTGKVLGAFFDTQETLYGYYSVTKQILEKYGIPYKIKTDKRTVFDYKRKGTTSDENDTFTQYSYAAKQLGIKIETSSVPEFKPRIERLFGTFQSRLNVELRLANITSLEEANAFLATLIEKYNAQFALVEDNTKNMFEKQISSEKINLILAILTRRTVDSGHSIRFKNKFYRFVNSKGTPIFFCKGTKCMVIESFDKSLYATVDESIFALEEIPEVQAYSYDFDKIPEVKQQYIFIPKMIHPWKSKSFEKFIENQKYRLELQETISTS